MEGFASLDAGAAASAVMFTALVAGPRRGKGRTVFCAVDNDIGFGCMHIRREQFYVRVTVQCMVLHRLEGIDKTGAAVGINEVIAAMDGKGYRLGFWAAATPNAIASMIALRFGTTVIFIVSSA